MIWKRSSVPLPWLDSALGGLVDVPRWSRASNPVWRMRGLAGTSQGSRRLGGGVLGTEMRERKSNLAGLIGPECPEWRTK